MAAVAGMVEPPPAIAGFWRRLAAFLVDVLIVSAALLILGFVLFSWTCSLGQAGRAIGLAAALLYFGLLDSRLTGGASPGKRLLGLRLVDRSGTPLSPVRAAVRCLVALTPWFVNGLWLGPAGPLAGLLGALQALLLFGLGGALLYLILFNRRTRQSVQDLATDSFVVRAAEGRAPIALRTAPLHLRIAGLWILLLLIGGSVAALWPADPAAAARSKPLGELYAALAKELGAGPVGVRLVTTTLTSPLTGSSSTSYLEVTVFRTRPDPRPDGAVILAAAGIVLRQAPDLLGRPLLSVQTVRGFDLGLAWWRIAYRGVYDAAEWRKLLLQFPGATRSS